MRLQNMLLVLVAFAFSLALSTAPASAQATRTWVSGVGDDVNPCSRTAPCKTFAGAISKTAAGGEISVLDPGGFGAVTVTKSMSITNDRTGEAGILASSTNGIVVNAAATDFVNIRGIVIDGGPPTATGLNGIKFLAGGQLHVQNCVIRNFGAAAPNGNGILFQPSSGTAELDVSDTVFTDNGTASSMAVFVQPTGSATVKATLIHVLANHNGNGFWADSTATTGKVSMTIIDSVASESLGHGIAVSSPALGGAATSNIMLDHVAATNNVANGVRALGAAAVARVGNSTITGNAVGMSAGTGGVIFTYGDNRIDGNGSTVAGTPLPRS